MTVDLVPRVKWRALDFNLCCCVVASCVIAMGFGILLPAAPFKAVAWLATILLAFAYPLWSLLAIVAVTAVVPYEVQDAFSVIGGNDRPSLFVVDVLLLIGLLRVGWRIIRGRLKVDLPLLIAGIFATVCAVAFVWGIRHGADVSTSGYEARRAILGVGAFLVAWPLVNDQTVRQRIGPILMAIGLVLGLWGLYQWLFSVGYTPAGDVGVRVSSVHSAPQLQGGLFVYPVAVVLAWTALISGRLRSRTVDWLLAAILIVNALCLALTFERTAWLATAIALLYVTTTSGSTARRLAVKWTGMGLVAIIGAALLRPDAARAALERLMSLGASSTEFSFKYRIFESQVVLEEMSARPVTGSGFGATITWGVKNLFGTTTTPFAHNGYLWLAWKVGLVAAVLVVVVLVRAVLLRCPEGDSAQWHIMWKGSKAAVLTVLITCITFPPFNSLAITATIGLLVAICYSASEIPSRAGSSAPALLPHRVGVRDDTQ